MLQRTVAVPIRTEIPINQEFDTTIRIDTAFGDIGTAWDDDDQFSKHFIGGGGVGIRVIMPWIQMIRFDLAFGEFDAMVHRHVTEAAAVIFVRFRDTLVESV